MKKLFAILAIAGVVTACNSSSETSTSADTTTITTMDSSTMMSPMDTSTMMSPMDTTATDTTTVR